MESPQKPHAVCIPFPAQGHINPMLKLAILLHNKGFHITILHTEYNRDRLLQSHGEGLPQLPDFQLAAIPDGLPPPEDGAATAAANSTQDIRSLCLSTRKNCLAPLNELIDKLNHRASRVPRVSCVIADMIMGFGLDAAQRIGVPGVLLHTASAVSFMCNKHVGQLVEKGIIPLKVGTDGLKEDVWVPREYGEHPLNPPVLISKCIIQGYVKKSNENYFTADESCLENGYMETSIDWIPGVIPLRLKDFSHAIRTTDPNDPLLDFIVTEVSRSSKAAAVIINTVDSLEQKVLSSLSSICPPIYAVGSLHLLLNQLPAGNALKSRSSSLWKEEPACLDWLKSKPEHSVLYVNFGSIAVLNPQQLSEFAWGIAESKKDFLWVVRPDLVRGGDAALPTEFWEEIGDRGFFAGWSPQEDVLGHAAVGGFLTHCGWNSVMESLCGGVPMLCWPFFADQKLNCRYACEEWGVGMEIGGDVKRGEVGFLVRELMDGERGKMLKKRAVEWRDKAAAAITAGGSSSLNLERLISEVLA
ncbi:hypothetical protein OROHE_024866 [Orobanche hederae]